MKTFLTIVKIIVMILILSSTITAIQTGVPYAFECGVILMLWMMVIELYWLKK